MAWDRQRSTLTIIEWDPGVLRKARFTFAPQHPDYNADERGDEDQKIDRRFHCPSPLPLGAGLSFRHTNQFQSDSTGPMFEVC